MRAITIRLLLALALWPLSGMALQAAVAEVEILDRHPRADQLATGQSLYLRIRYASPEPLRFQASAAVSGKHPAGAMMNPAPLYPAGDGEAVAWIAFRQATMPEQIELHVSNHSWKTLLTLPVSPAPVWGHSASSEPAPDWVARLSSEQQQMTSEHLQRANQSDGGDWLILLMAWSVPAYFLLQGWIWLRWHDNWRRAGLLPLWASVPVTGYTLFALLMGSNLWPLVMLFVMPVLFVYLAGVAALKLLKSTRDM